MSKNHIVILRGGLGNQMFQYALVIALRNKGYKVSINTSMYGLTTMHNNYELERVFGIKESIVPANVLHVTYLRGLLRFQPTFLLSQDKEEYDTSVLSSPKSYINGYWQDERYFKDVERKVRETFVFREIDVENEVFGMEIKQRNSISLHIRRGDYAEFGMSIIGKNYYAHAVEYIKEKVETPFFYIFSDDPHEAENIAKELGIEYKLITHNRKENSYKDMFLMSCCRHNIIANSSFSWWGAWLGEQKGRIVICPDKWNLKSDKIEPQLKHWCKIQTFKNNKI